MGGPVQEIVLRFSRSAAPYIQERIWHRSQQVEAVEDGELILRMRVGIAHELKSWLMSFGPNVKVLSPPALADEIRRQHLQAVEG